MKRGRSNPASIRLQKNLNKKLLGFKQIREKAFDFFFGRLFRTKV